MNEPDTEETKVIYRMWKKEGDVIAIFPEVVGTNDSQTCQSYMHVGQHGACSPELMIEETDPAQPHQYEALHKELEGRGYKLKIIKRMQRKFRAVRQKELREMNRHSPSLSALLGNFP